MKLCAVVVWYNPLSLENGRDAIANIQSYASVVDRVFIIDNSSSDWNDCLWSFSHFNEE